MNDQELYEFIDEILEQRSWVTSRHFLKRIFGVYAHSFVAGFIIGVVLFVLSLLFGGAGGGGGFF